MKEISEAEYETVTTSGLTLLEFGAEWCGPCQALLPVLEKLEGEMGDRVSFCSVDIDHDPMLAARNGVMSVPTILLVRDGQVVDRVVGLVTGRELRERIGTHLDG